MSTPWIVPGTGYHATFEKMREQRPDDGGSRWPPSGDEVFDDHADHLTDLHDQVDDLDGRLAAHVADGHGHGTATLDEGG